ncbi:MAG: M15 family metallopeptidase [Emcibacteraceae bacterium]|nr:M15 family metallopeptidase [Emcibacteraceae bacterium]
MRYFSKVFTVIFLILLSSNANSQNFDVNAKPAPAPLGLIEFLGEFEVDDKKVIIREDGGRLHAIFNPTVDGTRPENLKDWPLSFVSPAKYTYSFNGNFATFIFQYDNDKNVKALVINGEVYPRNNIEPRDGQSFKVTLDKSIEEYIADALKATPPKQEGDFREQDLVDVSEVLENLRLDVRYAGTNNFLNAPTYSQAKSFFQRPALMALNKANKKFNDMGYGILVHDAYRPWYVTKVFWDATEGFERDFVANPQSGSKHNMGSAIDLTLYDLKTGEVIKMVGTYDEMSDRSYPDYMGGTALERWYRDLLRTTIEAQGFKVVSNEWWHYDHEEWRNYPILNKTFEELLMN